MKIISKIPDDSFLLKVTSQELANILGFHSKYDIKDEFLKPAMSLEKDIEICDIYKDYHRITGILNSSEGETARGKLNNMLKALTPIENKMQSLIKETKIK